MEPDFQYLASKLENSIGYAAPEIRSETIAEALREAYNLGHTHARQEAATEKVSV
jgi:hypothetical protein